MQHFCDGRCCGLEEAAASGLQLWCRRVTQAVRLEARGAVRVSSRNSYAHEQAKAAAPCFASLPQPPA